MTVSEGRLIIVEEIGVSVDVGMSVSVDVGIGIGMSVSVDVGMIEDGMPESEGEAEGRSEEMGTTVTRELALSPRLIDELRIGTAVSVDAAVVVGSVAVVSATEETTEETALTIDERTGTMPRPELLSAVVVASSVSVEDAAAAAGVVEEPPMIVERPTMIPPVEVDALGVVEEATAADEKLDVGRMTVDGKSPVEPTSPLSEFVAEAAVVESVVSAVESGVVGEPSADGKIDSAAGSTPVEAAAGVVVGVTTEDGIPAVEPTSAVGISVVGVAASVVESAVESGVESAFEGLESGVESTFEGLEAGIIVLGKPPVEPTAAA